MQEIRFDKRDCLEKLLMFEVVVTCSLCALMRGSVYSPC